MTFHIFTRGRMEMSLMPVRHWLTTRQLNNHALLPKIRLPRLKFRRSIVSRCYNTATRSIVDTFDPTIPLSQAQTPPSVWYTDPSFLDLEFDRVFFRGWQTVGNVIIEIQFESTLTQDSYVLKTLPSSFFWFKDSLRR